MKVTQRAVARISVAIALPVLSAANLAVPAPASPARSAGQAAIAALKLVATIRVSSSPAAVAADPLTNRIYVANEAANTVSVISGPRNNVTATIRVGSA